MTGIHKNFGPSFGILSDAQRFPIMANKLKVKKTVIGLCQIERCSPSDTGHDAYMPDERFIVRQPDRWVHYQVAWQYGPRGSYE